MLGRLGAIGRSLAALPPVVVRVHAAENTTVLKTEAAPNNPAPAKVQDKPIAEMKRIRITELPIYGEPEPADLIFIPEEVSAVQQQMTRMRTAAGYDINRLTDSIAKIGDRYRTVKQYGTDMVKYLKEDAGALPRAAFITISGLGGVIAGYKGGVFRKTVFAGAGLLAAASVCYPHQAVDIAQQGWSKSKEEAKLLWERNVTKGTEGSKASEQPKSDKDPHRSVAGNGRKMDLESRKDHRETEHNDKDLRKVDAVKVAAKTEMVPKDATKKDFGMSKQEDKDMYSTRST